MHTKLIFFTLLFITVAGNAQELVSFRENAKYGFKDAGGKIIVLAKYSNVEDFKEGFSKVGLNGQYGFIDKSGKEIVPLVYDEADFFSEGLAKVKRDGLWGYIDRTGKLVIPMKYEMASSFMNGEATVWINRKSFIIDKTGKALTSQKYDGAASFSEGLSLVFIKKEPTIKYGFVDLSGKEIVPIIYDAATSFSEGLASVKLNNKWGFMDKTGKLTIPLQYDDAGVFHEGLAPVNIGGRIDKDGFFSGGKSGFIDKTGKPIIPLQYDKAKTFTKQGMAPVLLNGKWGVIDKAGTAITSMSYSELDAMKLSFSEELKNKYEKTKAGSASAQQNTQGNTATGRVPASTEKELSNVFSKTFNYQREWMGKWTVSGKPTSQKQIANVIFNVNKDEIKVYTGNGNLEDTHTIQFSKYGSHAQYGNGKFYTAKSKKYNTVADFVFFDNSSFGLLISWKDTYTQYLLIDQ